MGDTKIMRYETQIQLVPSSMKQLNKQFALVDILLCYHGDNRNRTSMSKEVIESALPSLYGIPIVGEYIYLDDGSKDFGNHGGKIILSDKGVKFEDTTKPYGFITKDAVDNAKWVTITEKDGFTQHEYLELKSCIVWEKRYEEVSSLLDKNYGQSMEISINAGHENENGYYVIEDMTFSAACILGSNPDGTDVIPCFESACIGRHYALDSFKQEFSLMLDEYKKLNESATAAVQNKETENNNPNTKGEIKMDLTKFTTLLSEIKYGDDCQKYSLLGANEENIYVADREDSKLYSVGYADTEDSVIINWDTKKEADITYTEKAENEENSTFSNILKDFEDDFNKKFEKEFDAKLEAKVKEISDDAESRLSEMKEKYLDIQNSYAVAKEKLDKFEAIEAEKAKENHINAVKETLERFEKKIGKTPEFIYYKAKVDYEKVDINEMEKELTLMTGDILMNKKDSNKTFSYNPTSVNVKTVTENETSSRYGNLLDAYMN